MKPWLKILLIVLLSLLIFIGLGLGYFYYQVEGKYDVDKEKYQHHIGHLSNPDDTTKFNICNKDRIVGWFASAATYVPIYRGSKSNFKKFIGQNYKKVNETENGFLNLRFIINCKGEVGRMEINQLDNNYKKTKLSSELVEQLVTLSSKKENWTVPKFDEEPRDSYMYLIFKIENGNIAEILP